MKTLHFETLIKAPVETVYATMLGEETFREWTAVFSPTSRYEGGWEKGSKILFLADEDDDKVCGMVSQINENKPNQFVSIRHIGIIENGQEITEGEKVTAFAGAMEEYTFEKGNDGTLLKVAMDATPEWEAYFNKTWPDALEKLKSVCEA